MGLLEKLTGLKVPYPGVRWGSHTGRILAATDAFRALPAEAQEVALTLPAWDFLKVSGEVYAKHIVEKTDTEETFSCCRRWDTTTPSKRFTSWRSKTAFSETSFMLSSSSSPCPSLSWRRKRSYALPLRTSFF